MNEPRLLPIDQISQSEVQKDAARYRWLRAKAHSLESQHGGGKSCYHKVGGVRELKSEAEPSIN